MDDSAKELAKKIMRGGLGKAELEFVNSLTTPIFWVTKKGDVIRVSNGSTFFLDEGEGTFGVTAAHVLAGWRKDRAAQGASVCHLGGAQNTTMIDIEERLIDEHAGIDIATFRMSRTEVTSLGKAVFRGSQASWPPPPPQRDRGVLIAGFPGCGTQVIRPREISFGAAPAGLIAHSINELDVSCLIEREEMMGLLGRGIPPENFDFGGMSGGPLLTIVEQAGIRSHRLGGVVYQGPNPSGDAAEAIAGLEIIKARRADFILPNGTLNRARWESATFGD